MNNFSFITILDFVINSIGSMNSDNYEDYINKNPHVQHYFDALCELYDVLEFYPVPIQNINFINDYNPLSITNDYFRLRKYCFSNNISAILDLQKLSPIFNNNYHEIFHYYENIICRKYKEEKIGYDDYDDESKEE